MLGHHFRVKCRRLSHSRKRLRVAAWTEWGGGVEVIIPGTLYTHEWTVLFSCLIARES